MPKLRLFLFMLSLLICSALVNGYHDEERRWDEDEEGEEEEEEWGEGGGEIGWGGEKDRFILQDTIHLLKTEAGEMRVVRGIGGKFGHSPIHIGFITMEPKSLLIPQYLDSTLVFFVRRGEAKIGSIYKDELVEQRLKVGDVYSVQAGSAFYLVNTAEGQRLEIICSIETSESLNWNAFQTFFIGGGVNPTSVLSGFGPETLENAFNVSYEELDDILHRQKSGAIVYFESNSTQPSIWARFLEQEKHERLAHMKMIMPSEEESRPGQNEQSVWSFRKLLRNVFGGYENRDDQIGRKKKSMDAYNLYDRKPDFRNNYGWSVAVDGHEYSPLKRSKVGVYLVNLTAGSMMAPHVNPTATEYGIVLQGTGNIQIVFPNGSLAMNAKVSEGEVFWVPRYFPFCQIASRSGAFEFFGFTTSPHRNRPQFLVGRNSILQTMRGPEFATAFGISEDRLNQIIDAQQEGIILPSPSAAPGDERLPRRPGDEGEPGEKEQPGREGEQGDKRRPGDEGQEGGKRRPQNKVKRGDNLLMDGLESAMNMEKRAIFGSDMFMGLH